MVAALVILMTEPTMLIMSQTKLYCIECHVTIFAVALSFLLYPPSTPN